eukprot:CAMPEP_0194059372 /NCGR_PEP_ID=MMETSP0009_2-20130614/68838_1 /TAXON_ID=210454 /ORGANISM="Grammatophora oceanica, Strain CCMP 410" /LENGTH=142 /DNA_ID=CAMNT_0038709905 /DNA_START=13 /DNA_END=438 /DNA_ORIENTATION=+
MILRSSFALSALLLQWTVHEYGAFQTPSRQRVFGVIKPRVIKKFPLASYLDDIQPSNSESSTDAEEGAPIGSGLGTMESPIILGAATPRETVADLNGAGLETMAEESEPPSVAGITGTLIVEEAGASEPEPIVDEIHEPFAE